MMSFIIITVLCATLLFNSGLARPRAPQSPRFPPVSDNSVGEFILWSCTATAQLRKNDVNNKDIIHIVPAAVDLPTIRFHLPSNLPAREDDDRINNINIIKVDPYFPHRNRGRPVPNDKKPNSEIIEITDQGTKIKNDVIPIILDSPIKTIKVNGFRKDVPTLFREKPQLPQVEYRPIKEDKNSQHSSEITIIKP